MARRARREEEEAGINITPMLDIVFIMLIFFIVTTTFVREAGIHPQRPLAETARSLPRGNIHIAISAEGEVWMERKSLERAHVRGMVEAARLRNPESSVVIIADERAPAGVLQDVMDEVRAAGVTQISVAAEPVPQ